MENDEQSDWTEEQATPDEVQPMSTAEQILYLQALACIANADGGLAESEAAKLQRQIDELEVSPEVKQAARDAMAYPPDIHVVCQALSASHAKFSLYLDAIAMAYADNVIHPDEENALQNLATSLQITEEKASALRAFAEAGRREHNNDASKAAQTEAAARLAAVGVPIGALAIVGPIGGAAAGFVTALGTLGLGFGLVPGVGVAIALGFGTYVGVKKLFG